MFSCQGQKEKMLHSRNSVNQVFLKQECKVHLKQECQALLEQKQQGYPGGNRGVKKRYRAMNKSSFGALF